MNEIYEIIAKHRYRLVRYANKFSITKTEKDDVVQECLLYFLQMNPNTLKDIYEKDGKEGVIRYGCVVIRRSLTSSRSPYYYKMNKYYTHISSLYETHTSSDHKNIQRFLDQFPEPEVPENYLKLEQIDTALDSMYWYDREVFKLYYGMKTENDMNTLDSLAEKTKISRNSLFTTIDKVRTELKRILVDTEDE